MRYQVHKNVIKGEIFVNGEKANINKPNNARQFDIETIYQTLALADNVDTAANLYLVRELLTRRGTVSDLNMEAKARDVMGRLNRQCERFHQPVRALSGGQRQFVTIARAILFDARILIMDEPTAEEVLAMIILGKCAPKAIPGPGPTSDVVYRSDNIAAS